jgi:hypothetical protein
MTRRSRGLLIFILVLLAATLFSFDRLYLRGIQALSDFTDSYIKYDRSIEDYFKSEADDREGKAREAVIDLQARKIADLSRREFESLKTYKAVIQRRDCDPSGPAIEYALLCGRRRSAYARFRELAEKGSNP